MISLPASYQRPADMILAGGLVGGATFATMVEQLNQWVVLAGGILGLIIGAVRVYEVVKPHIIKRKNKRL